MRLTNFLILVVISLLTACGAALPVTPEVGNDSANSTPSPIVAGTVEPPSVSPIATPTLAVMASPLNTPAATAAPTKVTQAGEENDVELSWNTDPNALIISATFCCGFVQPVTLLNALPDALIWGDGRILWVERENNGQRRVLEGQLSPEQVETLLQRIIDAGFFSWQDKYEDRSIADAAEQCLMVELEGQVKKVCEYVSGAPPAFHDLYAEIAQGAGATGTEYTPERGYLKAHPVELPEGFTPPVEAEWSTPSLGFALSEAIEGRWLEGDTLAQAWQMVNTKPQGAIIQDGENYYQLSIQLPGLSIVEPPAN